MLKDSFKKCTAFKMHLRSLPQVLQFFKKIPLRKKKFNLSLFLQELFTYLLIIIIVVFRFLF